MYDSNTVLQMAKLPGSIEALSKPQLEKFLQAMSVPLNDELRDRWAQAMQRARQALAKIEAKEAEDLAERRHLETVEATRAAAQRNQPHTLWAWWKLADWQERCGIFGTFAIVFGIGFLSAETRFFSKIIKLIIDIKP